VKQTASKARLLYAGILCGLLFDLEDIKAVCSSETSADFHLIALHYIPDDRTLHSHHYENLKSILVRLLPHHYFKEDKI
jgi:hypothetical protein